MANIDPRKILREQIKASKKSFILKNINIGNSLMIGDTGMGKSGLIVCLAEGLFDFRYKFKNDRRVKVKIFDLFDGGRGENMYWVLPNNSLLKYPMRKLKALNMVPKSYPCVMLYPYSKNIPNKIPPQGKVFGIAINSLTTDDLTALLGKDVSPSTLALWNKVFEKVNKKTTASELKYIINKVTKVKGKKKDDEIEEDNLQARKLISGAFGKLIENNLLVSGENKYALDLKTEVEDVDNISILVLRYIDKDLHGFLVNHFIEKIDKGLTYNKFKKPAATYYLLREVRELLQSDSSGNASRSGGEVAIKEKLKLLLAKWRTNQTAFIMDNQLSSTLVHDAAVLPQNYFIFRTSEARQTLENLGIRANSGVMNSMQFAASAMLPKLHCYVVNKNGEKAYLIKLNPPKHRIFNSGERFDEVYNNLCGNWKYLGEGKEIDYMKEFNEENHIARERISIQSAVDIQLEEKRKEFFKDFKKLDKEKKEIKKIPKNDKKPIESPKNIIKEPLLEPQDEVILPKDEQIYTPLDLSKEPIKVNGAGIDPDEIDQEDSDEFDEKIEELITPEKDNKKQEEINKIVEEKIKEEVNNKIIITDNSEEEFMNLLDE